MHLDYLGDALDHWKGSIFKDLQQTHFKDFAVDPMTTDTADWTDFHYNLYARLLCIEVTQIISHKHVVTDNRSLYFSEIIHDGDLFLDPDTGIETSRPKDSSKYVKPLEIHKWLHNHPVNVLVVYQHIRGMNSNKRINKIMDILSRDNVPFCSCSYESGTVAMLFFSRKDNRINEIFDHFSIILGDRAPGRVNHWNRLSSA